MNERRTAQQALNDALADPAKSLEMFGRLSPPRIPWWRRVLFAIPYKRTLRMQRYILKQLEKR